MYRKIIMAGRRMVTEVQENLTMAMRCNNHVNKSSRTTMTVFIILNHCTNNVGTDHSLGSDTKK